MNHNPILRAAMIGLATAGATGIAAAQSEVLVNSDIATSTTWTSNNTYNLQRQIYVLPGATLTIQAGTVVASTTGLGGSLAVTRGAQIFVQGTQTRPVIMTSKADVATWTGGDPATGSWREGANEWGNLTLMGSGYISNNQTVGNTSTPNPNNVAAMEGLTAAFPGDPKVFYGGGNDNDDSGTINFLSLRYGGKVIGLNNELNGLSLGGIGRGTDIHHVEVMNNVDDGIEIWGGTVNLKYISIWNIGDDSFDIDQGWRGKAQFLLLVQGYSVDAKQGSGVGDNCFETDGAEDSDWQPVTTTSIYNATVIGQPADGDGLTAWRDNARVQYHNCIFMDSGDEVVRFDDKDGDGANGYGFNGTLSWAATWTTPYTATSAVNAPANPAAFYQSQTSGMLAQITDSVFFRNEASGAYAEANAHNLFAAGNRNTFVAGNNIANAPIQSLTRGGAVVKGTKVMLPVTSLNPMPKNQALSSNAWAPNDGFYTSARYVGAFAPNNNWLCGWTAAEAFGFTPKGPWCDLGDSLIGTTGAPRAQGFGSLVGGSLVTVQVRNALANSAGGLVIGASRLDLPLFGGTLVPNADAIVRLTIDGAGSAAFKINWPFGFPKTTLYWQGWVADAAAPFNLSATNAISGTSP